METKVIVRDGKTVNLKKNFIAINGDLENMKSGQSTPLLEDGEYESDGFERVLQMDDSKDVWIMANDEQYAMRHGWPTRNTLYFFKSNVGEERVSPSIEFGVNESELLKYRKIDMFDINGVEIIEGSIINADGYNSNIDDCYFHCVEYYRGAFGSDVYSDFDLLSSYKRIEVVGHCSQFKYLIDHNMEWSGNLGAVMK